MRRNGCAGRMRTSPQKLIVEVLLGPRTARWRAVMGGRGSRDRCQGCFEWSSMWGREPRDGARRNGWRGRMSTSPQGPQMEPPMGPRSVRGCGMMRGADACKRRYGGLGCNSMHGHEPWEGRTVVARMRRAGLVRRRRACAWRTDVAHGHSRTDATRGRCCARALRADAGGGARTERGRDAKGGVG